MPWPYDLKIASNEAHEVGAGGGGGGESRAAVRISDGENEWVNGEKGQR